MFPDFLGYRTYACIFTVVSFLIGNVGLTQIITLAVPILMFLYPLAITLVFLALLSGIFGSRQAVYLSTTVFTLLAAVGDALNALPAGAKELSFVQDLLGVYAQLPFFQIGMGWVTPALLGLIIGLAYAGVRRHRFV